MSFSLAGKVILVTGAGRGIGRAHVRALVAYGARVVINDVVDPSAFVNTLQREGHDVIGDTSDLGSWAGARQAVRAAVDRYGRLDGLVNNAGVLRPADVADLDGGHVELELRVNVLGTMACTHFASDYWREQRRRSAPLAASVVNTVSDAVLTGAPGVVGYATTKGAVVAFTQTASIEGRQYGVRHNAVGPSGHTDMAASSGLLGGDGRGVPHPEDQDEQDPQNPAHNSSLVAWLLSDAAEHVSGQIFFMRHGAFSRMEKLELGDWHRPPDGARAWDPAQISGEMNTRVFASMYPEPMRHFPDGPSVPFARRDHG